MAAFDRLQDARHELLNVAHLPPLSTTATELIHAVADPDVDLRTVAGIIERDPPLAARLLGLANSAFFAQATAIVSIEQAIVRVLGLNMVKSLSLSMALAGSFSTRECTNFSLRDYWLRALGVAALAAGVGRRLRDEGRRPVDVLYLAGLLHSLGSLVLVHLRPKEMDQAYAQTDAGDRDGSVSMERELIGIDRWQAGEWLAFRWHLPEPIIHTLGQLANPAYDATHLAVIEVVRAARDWVLARTGDEPIVFRVAGIEEDLTSSVADELSERWDELVSLANTLA